MNEDLTPHEGLANDCFFFFFTSYSLSLPEKAKDTLSLCIHFPFICVLAGFLALFFPLPSHIHSPRCAHETWLISVRNLPYITRAGAHSCKSHDQYVGMAIMKMDGLTEPTAFLELFLRLHWFHTQTNVYVDFINIYFNSKMHVLVWLYLYF